ncbi:hypothetical protein GCM10009740_40990 [Terrabacter terrae]|uniref:Uncharacterized protein n=1 Tax=Terrabacter terrae TaxID=318434 RepID=A0ABN1ZY23_9MICO
MPATVPPLRTWPSGAIDASRRTLPTTVVWAAPLAGVPGSPPGAGVAEPDDELA